MIEDIDLERCKVGALKAMKLGLMRLDRIVAEEGKAFFSVTSATTAGVEYRLHYAPYAPGESGKLCLICECVLYEQQGLCHHVGACLLAGFPYEMDTMQARLMDVCMDASEMEPDGCPHVWREALEALERGEDRYHWALGD